MRQLYRKSATPDSREKTLADLLAKPDSWWRQMGQQTPPPNDAAKIAIFDELNAACEVWVNDIYCVHKRSMGHGSNGELIHLSIKRHDRAPVSDWRDKQAIKNQLCGEDAEGMELYPAESRVVDTSNQYHLWVFVGGTLPVGFPVGAKMDKDDELGNAKQRAFQKQPTKTTKE